MAGTFFRQFRATACDWMIGAFVGATLDFFFSMVKTKSHLLQHISALVQITCATLVAHEIIYAMGLRKGSNTIQGTWLLTTAIWWMSPNAVIKLRNSYYAFHRMLYGTKSIVEELSPTTSDDEAESKKASCKNNCSEK